MSPNVQALVDALLNDENGISQAAFEALREIVYADARENGGIRHAEQVLNEFVDSVDATDGRFYFPIEDNDYTDEEISGGSHGNEYEGPFAVV